MKAVICKEYGNPDVLEIKDIPKPIPNNDQVLVKIMATAVNSGDVRVRGLKVKGFMKFVMQLVLGFHKPRKQILGTVFSGIIENVGKNVTKFNIGDSVFGMTGFKFGTYAEYIAVNQDSNVLAMPKNASYEEAVAIVFGGQTAFYFLDKARITKMDNPKILIIGASGSVGAAAIQIAKYFNADVTAICSTRGHNFVTELGVDKVFLYDLKNEFKITERFDIIFDAFGKSSKKYYTEFLNDGGYYKSVSIGYASESIEQLKFLKYLFEKGDLKASIDKIFSLNEIIDAHRYVDTFRKKGNVVIRVAELKN